MSNPYPSLANISAIPPSFLQGNGNMSDHLNRANLQQMGADYGIQMPGQQQGMYKPQQQFNMSALANIPASALDGIQLPGQSQHAMQLPQQQQSQPQSNQTNNFNQALQTFQRMQAQESQKTEQQRIGMGNGQSGQAQQQLPQSQLGQQQFLQQMGQMARLQQQQVQRQVGGGNGVQQMANMNGVNMQAVLAGMAQGMGQGGQGPNMHSQQQGLQQGGRSGDEDMDASRRIQLQNMLAQTLAPGVGGPQQQQPYQQQTQLPPPFQSQQQAPQQSSGNNSNLHPDLLQVIMKLPTQQREALMSKHNGNLSAVMHELMQHAQRAQLQQGQGQGGSTPNLQQAQPRQALAISVNGMTQQQMQQQQQQQQQQGRGGQGHQRSDSQQMMGNQGQVTTQMQGQVGNPGQSGQGVNFDPKQFEALQQMKERQQRQSGLITPQMPHNAALPMVSPQPLPQMLQVQQQQPQQQYRQTPQNVPAQLPPQQNFAPQQQQQQLQQQQQQTQAGGRPNQGQTEDGPKRSTVEIIRTLTDEQLRGYTANVLKRLVSGPSPKDDPSRFQLLTLISDFKRRDIAVPQEAINAIGAILGNGPGVQQILGANWQAIQAFAQRSAGQVPSGQSNQSQPTVPAQFRQPQLPQQLPQAPYPPQRQSSMTGSAGNPIEIVTPKLGSSSALPNPYTPNSQNGQLQPVPGHHRAASFTSGRNFVPSPQQAQQSIPPPQQVQNPTPRWGGMDFSGEPLPFSEAQIWDSLKKMHKRQDLPIPIVEGRPIDVYALFGLVHRNGGSAKLDQNPVMWQIVAGHLGFGQNTGEQPARASQVTASELRRTYAGYLGAFEEAWYKKLYENQQMRNHSQQPQMPRQSISNPNYAASQSSISSNQYNGPIPGSVGSSTQALPVQQMQMLQQQQQQFQNLLQQAQQTNQPFPPGLSAQLLEAASKNNGVLTDAQRQYIEQARRGSQATSGANGTPNMSTVGLSTPGQSSQMGLPQMQGLNPQMGNPAAAAMLAAQNQAQIASASQFGGGPAVMQHAAQTLKGNPQLCLQWIKSKEEQMKSKFPTRFVEVAEPLRPQLLADLRTLAGAARDAQERMPKYQLVAAERSPEEFAKISGLIQLYMAILITYQHAEQGRFCFSPDHVHKLKYQLATLITNANTLYEEYRAGPEGPARVDRLFGGFVKASPRDTGNNGGGNTTALAANMPKGLRVEDLKPPPSKRAKGKAGAGTNSSPAPGAAPTPEAAKTPASHLADSPIATSSPAGPVKKASAKRKRGATVTVKEDNKDTGAKESPSGHMPPPPAPQPVDVVPTAAEMAAAQQRAFFKARAEVEKGETDILAALHSAVEEFNKALSTPTGTIPPSGTGTAKPDTETDRSFFAQWIDVDQLNELPTPELYHPGWTEEDLDTSPESIKTVPSTTQLVVPLPAVEKVDEGDEERRLIGLSPGSAAYNGGLFWEEYDFGTGIAM